jgi:hypothetical protein
MGPSLVYRLGDGQPLELGLRQGRGIFLTARLGTKSGALRRQEGYRALLDATRPSVTASLKQGRLNKWGRTRLGEWSDIIIPRSFRGPRVLFDRAGDQDET